MTALARHIILLVACFSAICFAHAQSTGSTAYAINEDDNSSKILSLIKNKQGYLLAGTTTGLYRFNGSQFFPVSIHPSIKTKAVTALAEDPGGKLWVGFQNGEIATLQNGVVVPYITEEGHPSVAITSIEAKQNGLPFFSTAGEGVYYLFKNRFYNINIDDGLSDNYVYQVVHTQQGLIAGTDRGYNVISITNGKKIVEQFTTAKGLPDNIVRCIQHGVKNHLWLGFQDKGVGLYDRKYNTVTNSAAWQLGQVNSLLLQKNDLLVATEEQGVYCICDLDTGVPQGAHPLIAGYPKATNLLADDEGNTWFSSNHQLIKSTGTQLQTIIPLAAGKAANAHAILADKKGNVWMNSATGVTKYTPTGHAYTSKEYRVSLINSPSDITSLYEDPFGNIWIGTLGKGVVVLDPTTGKQRNIKEDNLLVNGSVLSINGRGNDIWISSFGGAVKCTLEPANRDINLPIKFVEYNKVSGIGSNYIYSTLIDSKGRVWFATDGKGVTVLENGKFFNYNKSHGLRSQIIYSLCEDNLGNIWISAMNDGLYKFDGHTFQNIGVEDGLNDPTVTALSLDAKGNIVAITKKGVNLIDANTHAISYLNINQGVEEINTDCIAKANGKVYFVASKGVLQFSAEYQWLQPQVVLERVKLFLNEVDMISNGTFAYDENNFSFEFSGISFSHPDKVRYQYKLDGLSGTWITTQDNSINFPQLPPGRYTFRVRAAINNRFDNSKEAVYTFTINKPFYFQWWFVGLMLVTIIAGIYLFVKAREQRVKRWDRIEKEKIQAQFETLKSQVNPHFLFNSFNTLISVIEDNPESAVEYVEHLSDLYRKIVTYRDKDTITLREEVELINDYFFIQQQRFGQNLRLDFNLSEEQLRNYLIAPLTLQLLCENAVKHNAISADTPLLIELSIAGEVLVVKNNINPKLTAEKSAGMGLQNIQKRYQLLSKTEISIEHTAQHFVVYIPLLRELS